MRLLAVLLVLLMGVAFRARPQPQVQSKSWLFDDLSPEPVRQVPRHKLYYCRPEPQHEMYCMYRDVHPHRSCSCTTSLAFGICVCWL